MVSLWIPMWNNYNKLLVRMLSYLLEIVKGILLRFLTLTLWVQSS